MLLYYSLAAFLSLLHRTHAASSVAGAAGAATAATPTQSSTPDTGVWPTDIVGTWSSKSRAVVTGPGFYDPLSDELIEPALTGISYSFTSDGYYEESYFRAVSNPSAPTCPTGLLQWQHGKWVYNTDGSLQLTPISVDGRQLTSQPCFYSNSIYVRYNQSEHFKQYSQYTDPYHNVPRLDLYQFDGTPMMPLYLVYQPPQMLPTTTLNPITSATATSGSNKVKRGDGMLGGAEVPINWKSTLEAGSQNSVVQHINADRLWWVGLAMTGLGGLLYLGPRRMGVQI